MGEDKTKEGKPAQLWERSFDDSGYFTLKNTKSKLFLKGQNLPSPTTLTIGVIGHFSDKALDSGEYFTSTGNKKTATKNGELWTLKGNGMNFDHANWEACFKARPTW